MSPVSLLFILFLLLWRACPLVLRSSPVFPIAASVCVPLGGGVLHQLSVAASVCVPLGGGVLHQLSVAASVCVPLGGEVLHQLSVAASVCVPLGGGVLHQLSVAASVCVPLGGGVLHQLSVAASVCVPLGGGVLHQLSRAASVCVPLGGGVLHLLSRAASVCVPLAWRCGFTPAFSCCVSVRAPRRESLHQLLVSASLRSCAIRCGVGSAVSCPMLLLLRRAHLFGELLMPRAVSCLPTVLWVRSLLVASSQSPSSYYLVTALHSIGLFGSYPLL